MTRARWLLLPALLILLAANREQDNDERSVVRQWLREHVEGDWKELRWWAAKDFGETSGNFASKNFRVLRAQVKSKDGKTIDRVYMIDPDPWGFHDSADWAGIDATSPAAFYWYRDKFPLIYPQEPETSKKRPAKRR